MFDKLFVNRSIFAKILFINIFISLCIIAYLYYNNNYIINNANIKMRQTTLSQLSVIRSNINTEIMRLKSINFAMSYDITFNQYNTIDYYSNYEKISNLVKLTKAAIPYSVNYHIFAHNYNIMISDTGSYSPEVFIADLKNKYPFSDIYAKDLIALPDGINIFNDFILYISRVHPNIIIYTEISKNLFSTYNLQKFSNTDFCYVAYYNNNQVITESASLPTSSKNIYANANLGKDLIKINNIEYNLITLSDVISGLNLKLVCIFPSKITETDTQITNLYTMLGIMFFLFINLIAIFFQYRLYFPFKKLITQLSFSNEKASGYEANVIYSAFKDLKEDKKNLELLVNQSKDVYKIQALLSLIHGEKKEIDKEIIDNLNNDFNNYVVLTYMFDLNSDNVKAFENNMEESFFIVRVLMDEHSSVYIISCNDNEYLGNFINATIKSIGIQAISVCGISNVFSGIENICTAYLQSIHSVYDSNISILLDNNICFFSENTERLNYILPADEEKRLIDLVISGKNAYVEKFFDTFLPEQTKYISYKNYKRLYAHLVNIVDNILYIKNIKDQDVNDIILDIDTIVSIARIHDYVKQRFINTSLLCNNQTGDLHERIVNYINKNINKDLSINALSSAFNITPEYLSTLFKKKSGLNLSVYINKMRIQTAINILNVDKKIKVSDLAEKVGFETVHTFIRQFKSYTGTTPAQYKESKPNNSFHTNIH